MRTIDPRQWLGLSFRLGGREPAIGLDCWGLYRLIVRETTGVDLGEHGEVDAYPAAVREMARARTSSAWRPIAFGAERPTDLVSMTGLYRDATERTRSAPLHVGCVVAPGLMIDIEETTGVMVRPFRDVAGRAALPTVVPRLLGIWRHEALEAIL